MHLVGADMDRRALVPAALRPTIAGAGAEVGKLVVAALLPHHHLAAGNPHMREVAGGVDRDLVTVIDARHIGVHHGHRFLQGNVGHCGPLLRWLVMKALKSNGSSNPLASPSSRAVRRSAILSS